MATAPESAPEIAAAIAPGDPPADLRRFSAEDFKRMAQAGLFRPEERPEWIKGVIYDQIADAPKRHRFNVDDYYQLAEMGILRDRERVELLNGEIFVKSPKDSVHSSRVSYLNATFSKGVGRRAIVSPQLPLRLCDHSEPEPDLCLLRMRADSYRSGHPRPEDAYLIIEVMNISAAYDRTKKLPAYAASGIPEVWLADLMGEFVEAHRGLRDGVYTEVRICDRGQSIAPEAFPDLVLSIDEILG